MITIDLIYVNPSFVFCDNVIIIIVEGVFTAEIIDYFLLYLGNINLTIIINSKCVI